MIDIPVDRIIAKIVEEKGLTEEEVKAKIAAKLKELSGLISEEGAAHIIAKEEGVNLMRLSEEFLKINELKPGMKSANTIVKVVRKYDVREFDRNGKKGKVAGFFVGDESGNMRVTLWNDQVDDYYSKFSEGDVLKIKNAIVKENRGYSELHLTSVSELEVNPEGVSVKSRERGQNDERRFVRKTISELTGDENEPIEILGTIVQIFDPRFFEICPQCRKRVRPNENGEYHCEEHGKIEPEYNYVVSAFIDDGTGNIRATFWKSQTERLTERKEEEFLKYREEPGQFREVIEELLGEIIKIKGTVKKNEAFNNIDFNVYIVEKDVDPLKELAKLESKEEEPGEQDNNNNNNNNSNKVKEEVKKGLESASDENNIESEQESQEEKKKEEGKGETEEIGVVEETETKEESEEEKGSDSDALDDEIVTLDDLDDL